MGARQSAESQGNSFPSKPTRLQQNPAAGTDRHDLCSVGLQGFNPSHAGFSPPKSHVVWWLLCLSVLLVPWQSLGRNLGASGCALGSHWNFVWPSPHSTPVNGGATCVCLCLCSPPGTVGTTLSWCPVHREPVCQAGQPPPAVSSWPMVSNYIWESVGVPQSHNLARRCL